MSVLEYRDVDVRYGDATAVARFSACVRSGEWLGVIGPNGAGKSSLLRAAVGLVAATGQIIVDGRPVTSLSLRQRASLVAYVPQTPLMPGDMTGREYVLLGRSPYIPYFGSPTRADRLRVADVLSELDLGELSPRPLASLSGGERQRFVIARALAQDAPILLLDEPTSALDIGHQQQAMELVARLRRERELTVISAMHDLTLAGLYSDRMVLLHAGHLVASGTPAEVLRAETLAEFYGVRVTVQHEPDGTVAVIPRRDHIGTVRRNVPDRADFL